MTGEIPVEVGLKQGCVLSPMLFSLYLQELGEELMASGDGVWIGSEGNERKIPGLFFADDMILIADSKRGLQHLLNIVGRFGVHQKLTFSPEKSKVIVNWRKPIQNRGWSIGSFNIQEGGHGQIRVVIEETQEYKYLGLFVRVRGNIFKRNSDEVLKKARNRCNLVKMVGYQSGGLIWVMDKIWQHVAKPAILYGSEVFYLSAMQQLKLERIQRLR